MQKSSNFLGVAVAVAFAGVLCTEVAKQFVESHFSQLCFGVAGVVVWQLWQCQLTMEKLRKSLYQVEITSQVCATRANIMEWRSCLAFTAKWYECSLQSAYTRWRWNAVSIPSCPANQSVEFLSDGSRGQYLNPVDEAKSMT